MSEHNNTYPELPTYITDMFFQWGPTLSLAYFNFNKKYSELCEALSVIIINVSMYIGGKNFIP